MDTIYTNSDQQYDDVLLELSSNRTSGSVTEAIMLQHAELRLPRHLTTEHAGSQVLFFANAK